MSAPSVPLVIIAFSLSSYIFSILHAEIPLERFYLVSLSYSLEQSGLCFFSLKMQKLTQAVKQAYRRTSERELKNWGEILSEVAFLILFFVPNNES